MIAAANPLQAAIYTAITGDTGAGGLMAGGGAALILGCFDAAGLPEAQAMPYVTIGWFDSSPALRTMGKNGEEVLASIHVWTQKRGFKSGNDILKRLNMLFGDNALTVTGYSIARSLFERSQNVADPDTDVEHIVATYRVIMGET